MSISTTESINGDITADQEHLGPSFANLDPSEALRLLERKRQPLREKFMKKERKLKELKEKMKHTKVFVGKLLKRIKASQTIAKLVLNELENSLKKELKRCHKMHTGREKIIKAKIAAAVLEHQLKRVKELEECQNEQLQDVDEMLKEDAAMLNDALGKGLTPQNRWDSAACHDELALSEPERLIVQFTGENSTWRSVFAERPLPKSLFAIFYYEVKILKEKCIAFIGLATKKMPLHKCIGYERTTYAYDSWGRLWGHAAVAGCSHWNGRPYIDGMPKFGVRDVVGCGINLATRQIFYTKNGHRLETAGLVVDSAAGLFPFTLHDSGDKIEANFGPNFKLKIADSF